MPLKRVVLYFFALIFSVGLSAQQQTGDFGLFGGGAIPISDYSKLNILQSIKPNVGLFYRYNFNSRYSFRMNGIFGNVGANGFLNDMTVPPISFKKQVVDLGLLFEINYLDFLIGEKRMNFSPYVYYGIGLSFFPGVNGNMVMTANLPIGTGVKYAFAKRWAVGAEVSGHKLFNDKLDDLNNPYQNAYLVKVNDSFHNNDWISYFGLTLTYKFYWGQKACPAYNSIND
ncbi:MAG: DUF6089 family protein [Prolixibacteraceae bacterium]